ncbi:MAG: 4Fe-4S binding protein [Candidatus Aegiribacteria sp.]
MTRRTVTVIAILLILAAAAFAQTVYRVDKAACTGCGDCVSVCPVDAVEIIDGKSHIDPEKCIGCGFCQGVCSYDAIR